MRFPLAEWAVRSDIEGMAGLFSRSRSRVALALGLGGLLAPWIAPPAARADAVTASLSLPPGFAIEVFAHAPGARSLALAEPLGAVFVATRGDTIYAVPLGDDDGLHPTYPVLTGLNGANGIAWRDGYLYVGEQHRLTRYFVPRLDALTQAAPEVLYDRLPNKPWHGWRYLAFGADGALYVGIGAPCNICTPQGLEGTVTRFWPGRWDRPEIAARGVRNTVGMDVHPVTGVLHFTDNGADGMGDDSPPDELNALAANPDGGDAHYGFPWFGGGTDRTAEMRDTVPPDTIAPVVAFQAHVAPLGVDFYSGRQFPADYKHDAFVAQHGSWNRSSPVGYRVMRIRFDAAGNVTGREPFISGWLRPDGSKTGRPVDLEELPDGSLLISDDATGRIYRVTYKKP